LKKDSVCSIAICCPSKNYQKNHLFIFLKWQKEDSIELLMTQKGVGLKPDPIEAAQLFFQKRVEAGTAQRRVAVWVARRWVEGEGVRKGAEE
jgi:hypothetical protein